MSVQAVLKEQQAFKIRSALESMKFGIEILKCLGKEDSENDRKVIIEQMDLKAREIENEWTRLKSQINLF